jgi:hypothetical protein
VVRCVRELCSSPTRSLWCGFVAAEADPAQEPRALDIVGTKGPNQGKTILAIYELTDSNLRICYDLSGKARPKEFKTKADTQLFLVEYKRQKS